MNVQVFTDPAGRVDVVGLLVCNIDVVLASALVPLAGRARLQARVPIATRIDAAIDGAGDDYIVWSSPSTWLLARLTDGR